MVQRWRGCVKSLAHQRSQKTTPPAAGQGELGHRRPEKYGLYFLYARPKKKYARPHQLTA